MLFNLSRGSAEDQASTENMLFFTDKFTLGSWSSHYPAFFLLFVRFY